MSKFLHSLKSVLGTMVMSGMLISAPIANAQQLTNAGFEDWNGATFDGEIQPKGWNASNVEQVGFKFNFAHRESGHTGSYSMMVQDQSVGAMGVTATSPGYFSLGQPWAYLPSITQINSATAGTYGGVSWTYRPDSMSVWIKRTGDNTAKEDFYLLYYAWTGTAKGDKYKGKNGNCTSYSATNEESDIRQALDGNECGTTTKATQICEGMWRERKTYGSWTNIRVPIYYMNNTVPTMMNIIFSASNYPNFRANDGLYEGNSLYVDDVELIYSASIQKLYVGGKEWKGFDPNSTDVQVYALGESATEIPAIEAIRGAGSLTNAHGTTVTFPGRTLSGDEISIVYGDLESKPTVITVTSDDKKTTKDYKIQFQKAASSNAKLASISLELPSQTIALAGFSPTKYNYTAELPYGTTTVPTIIAEGQEDQQTIEITQATSLSGQATIKVTAANGTTTQTYTIAFTVAQLADNTLQNILVNGSEVAGFTPTQTIYKVSLPTSTTEMPTVQAISAYPEGEQTIVYTAPSTINGGTYQISVTTPGNPVAKVYKLNFKLEASSYSYLKSLRVEGDQVQRCNPALQSDSAQISFDPENTTYYVNLKMGTTSLPEIVWEKGDDYQTVEASSLGEKVVDGTVRVTVTAGNGDQTVYKLVFSTEKSEISTLKGIEIDGTPLAGFRPDSTYYTYALPIGTTELPTITPIQGDEYQTIEITPAGLNGKTRITVTAGDGSTTIYQIAFSVESYTDNTLKSLMLDGVLIEGFDPEVNEYYVNLPQGTTALPAVTYELQNDQLQTVNERAISTLNGDYKITVRPQSGASRTYIIHFAVATSSNTALEMILVDGVNLPDFDAEKLDYTYTLPEGVSTIPAVTFVKAESGQRVLSMLENKTQTITVTAESGAKRVYTITFIIQVSENAFLEMIYLDGVELPGFRKDSLTYTVQLTSATCPLITVDKAAGQQVTITAPYAAGIAYIKVQPEQGAINTYQIEFEAVASESARLKNIFVDGEPLADFQPTKLTYNASYQRNLPEVTYEKGADDQTVTVLWHDSIAWLHVADAAGNKAAYSVTFTRVRSTNNQLTAILIDDVPMAEFVPTTLNYTRELPAGSKYPTVSYVVAEEVQIIYFGQMSTGKWGISVASEDGEIATYTVQFTILPYDDATLADLSVSGQSLTFDANTFEYTLTIDDGAQLPDVNVVGKEGQTIVSYNASENEQRVIVTAESGRTNTYIITYTRVQSGNALLADILIDGKSLEGFDPTIHNYTDSLAWRTKVVPNVFPVAQLSTQVITTEFSRPNGTTRITVEAQDGTTASYSIYFPVHKSSNTLLEDLYLSSEDVEIDFKPTTTEYVVEMPYQATACPPIVFEKAEAEQRIDFISRPLGQTSEIIVTAENGDTRTYSILFKETPAAEANLLQSLYIVELEKSLSLKNKTQRDFEVALPYGTRTMTVEYTKNYEEQTVFVQPGGVYNPTIITVKANRGDEEDQVYTITPQLATQNPAILNSIEVDGTAIEDFDPNRFTYIVNRTVTTSPKVKVTKNSGVEYDVENSLYSWQAEVSKDGYTNTYKVFFHYTNDVIPNYDFTSWTTTATSSSDKPASWNAPGDYLGTYLWTAKASDVIFKENATVVHLKTDYWAALAGAIPSVLNLATMTGKFAVAGGTTVTPSGFIGFHNTPDVATVNYKYTSQAGNGALFRFKFFDTDGEEHTFDHTQTSTKSSYASYSTALATDGVAVTGLDIIIDATGQYPKASSGADLYVDWVKFAYNSAPKAAKANGIDATLGGKVFTVTLTDPEDVNLPSYEFNGEVSDQAQLLTWAEPTVEGNYSVRSATLRNYAEDGTYTDGYSLRVLRPLDTRNQLSELNVDNAVITGFAADKYEYTYHLTSNVKHLPDVVPVAASSLQTITTNYADSTYTITVTPEKGETKTYTIRFVTDLSDDTTLAALNAAGITYDPTVTEYDIEAEQWPLITYAKQSDSQTVSLVNGVITVTAENGATGTYTIIKNQPTYAVDGYMKEFEIAGNIMTDLGGTTFECEKPKPAEAVLFTRRTQTDSVVFVQDAQKMQWQIVGGQTYTYTYPTTLSSNANLGNIYVDGEAYEAFHSYEMEYIIYSDTAIQIEAIADEEEQILTTTTTTIEGGTEYTTIVTAADGVTKKTYKLQVLRPLSNIATLAGLMLDSVMISDFAPEQTKYTITIPTPQVKTEQPKMPSVTYIVGQKGQAVELTPGGLGETTYLEVTSEDKTATMYYELTVVAEPSHCVDLSGITVNGEMLDHFESGRHFYSVSLPTSDVEIDYMSNDRFQKVTIDTTEVKPEQEYIYVLHVVAEDKLLSSDYQVEIYVENQSSDAFLQNITLDGKNFVDFERAINPDLSYDQGQNYYRINLPSGTTVLPEVSAQLKMNGQKVVIDQKTDTIQLHVTAVDGVSTNTYTLHFVIPKSKNADLSMIFLNGDSLQGFAPDYYFYQVTLAEGVHSLPEVAAQKGDAYQTILPIVVDEAKQQALIQVQAEDTTTRVNTYILVFHYTQSDADTLRMIYADGSNLPTYQPHTFYYNDSLPVGTQYFPDLSWEEQDEWQTIQMDTVMESENVLIRQILVTAESGKKNTYTVSYTIRKSAIDTLQMIYIDQKALADFRSDIQEYNYTLPATYIAEHNGALPVVDFIAGDEYQKVVITEAKDSLNEKSLGYKTLVTVTAASGATRAYTIHYPVELSTETTLNMIMLSGKPLANYDAERNTYRVAIEMEAAVPVVSVVKKEDVQTYEIRVSEDTVMIDVVAEDTRFSQTYTLVFERQMSGVTKLRDIVLTDDDGQTFPAAQFPFRPEVYEYVVNLPYDADDDDPLPAIEAILTDAQQVVDTIHYVLPNGDIQVDINVTAPNGEDQALYSITFHFVKNNDALLKAIFINDELIPNFNSQTTEYEYAHPFGSTEDDFFGLEVLDYLLSDTLAKANAWITEDGTIYIQVIAQDGTTEVNYTIRQTIALDSDCALISISLDGIELRNFDSEITFYTYYLREGETPPEILAVPRSENAEVDFRAVSAGDTCRIICTAASGAERVYYVHFAISSLNDALTPTENDILLIRVPGSLQLFAATIRQDVALALYDQYGHLLYYEKVPVANPNDADVVVDASGDERLNTVVDYSAGLLVDILPNQVYFYAFYEESTHNRISSGKLMARP